jgi:glycosyltransferase involved in cell wall biosynthesis
VERPVKVAVIFHRFGPYHRARLDAAAQRCQVVGIELGAETREYQWSKVDEPLSFERITLFPEGDSRTRPVAELEMRIRDALSASRPDAVAIPGWSEKGALTALRWCLEEGVPAVLMSETTASDEPRVWWKELVKRRIIALCSTALVGGQRHKDYLTDLGMPADRIFTGYDVVDNEHFARGAEEARGQRSEDGGQRSEVRDRLGLPENYFLASARFIPKKNLETLIRAYAEYRRTILTSDHQVPTSALRPLSSDLWPLVLLGDGPLRPELEHLISDLRLLTSALLPGFKQYDELPAYYGLAKAFVHASSTEQWGLVVNEALASGLPVLVSDRCGCAPELVRDGLNGFTFDPGNQEQLTSRLLEMSALAIQERERMGQAGREIAAQFAPEKFGEGLESAARLALSQARKNLGSVDRLILSRMLSR